MSHITLLPVAVFAAVALLAPVSAESHNECCFTTQSTQQSCRIEGIGDCWARRDDCLNDTSSRFGSCIVDAEVDLIDPGLNLLFAVRSLGCIGDRCRNISEYIAYIVQGWDVRHTRFGQLTRQHIGSQGGQQIGLRSEEISAEVS